jgi:hypothetical protein
LSRAVESIDGRDFQAIMDQACNKPRPDGAGPKTSREIKGRLSAMPISALTQFQDIADRGVMVRRFDTLLEWLRRLETAEPA